jgi:ATP-dependent helicase HrpB
MVMMSRRLSLLPLACDVAAILEERDFLRTERAGEDADIGTRVAALQRFRRGRSAPTNADRGTLERVLREADKLRRESGAGDAHADERATGLLLAFAYPDRIAMRREVASSRYLMRNGSGAALAVSQALSGSELLVVADVDGRKPEARIWLAAPVDVVDVVAHFGDQIEVQTAHEWDEESNSVRLVRRERLGALVLRETRAAPSDNVEAARVLMEQLRATRLALLPWSEGAKQLRLRVEFARAHEQGWPDVSDATLLATMSEWLPQHVAGMRSASDLRRLDLTAVLYGMIGWQRRAELDGIAPSHVVVPTGSRVPVDYSDPAAPMIAVRLQELFGMEETPRLMRGRVPVVIQLLSPAGRPVQVTRDLAGFWRTSYFDVRKEMRGRYPRHHWPENPLEAEPTRRARRRG